MSAAPVDRLAWQDAAVCARPEVDPEMFYAPSHARSPEMKAKAEERARAVCAGCPVAAECLEDALTDRDWHGIRGGLTGEERQALARRRYRAQRRSS